MKLTKILALVAVFALASLAVGCGKKDKNKNEPAKTEQPATPAKPTADKPATPPANTDADMEAGLAITEKLADVIDANKDDCAKMAEAITAFYEENKDAIEKGKSLAGKMTPEDAAKFAEKYKDRIAAYTAKMAGGGKCMADKAVMDAMKALQPAPKEPAAAPAEPAKDEPAKADPAKAEPDKKAP